MELSPCIASGNYFSSHATASCVTQFVLTREPDETSLGVDADSILSGLNSAQQEAVRVTDGPLLIIAGPGSGKTRTLTHRIAYLLATGKASPRQILAITFTNKAAREMRSRVTGLVGEDTTRGMWIGTFHSSFARLLRAECARLGFTSDFSIYDSEDSQRVIRDLLKSRQIDTTQYRPRLIQNLISGAKNRMVSPSQYATMAASATQEIAARVFQPYQDRLRTANAMDFDDLLLRPIDLFRNHEDVLEKYQNIWKYIHVDEYQDTNRAQYLLAKLLASKTQNLCVVGDDAQSIYAFRGADIANILSFQKDYPDATTVRLEQNYRSSKNIVRLADSIIRNNKDQLEKKLFTENADGDPIIVIEALSEREEAQKVERRIRDIQVRLGLHHSDFAVLYRTNAQSRSFEDALRRGSIPYRVVGGMSFYQRREIKDALAYLRLVVNPNDVASLRRVINTPARGIGDKTQNQLFDFADKEGIGTWEAMDRVDEGFLTTRAATAISKFRDLVNRHRDQMNELLASELARALIQESGILEEFRREHTPENLARWENIQELLNAISEFTESGTEDRTLSTFLQEISLLTDADDSDPSENRVTLMTLHASKGLEFPVVFLCGMEEGLFPLASATQDRQELEEERRLFYVGATRAERLLMLSYARSRYRYGEQQSSIRSRFFEEIDPSVLRTEAGQLFETNTDRMKLSAGLNVKYEELDPHYYRKSLRSESSGPAEQRVVYDEEESGEIVPGMRVEHSLFGEGKVIAKEGRGDQVKAVVYFRNVGEKKLLLKFARLKRIG